MDVKIDPAIADTMRRRGKRFSAPDEDVDAPKPKKIRSKSQSKEVPGSRAKVKKLAPRTPDSKIKAGSGPWSINKAGKASSSSRKATTTTAGPAGKVESKEGDAPPKRKLRFRKT
jgi:hypothetical protein